MKSQRQDTRKVLNEADEEEISEEVNEKTCYLKWLLTNLDTNSFSVFFLFRVNLKMEVIKFIY
jgi:hypothetical protein